MPLFFRIQPKGLGIRHRSEGSAGVRYGLDVFDSSAGTFNTDVPAGYYGDEVVVIRATRSWNNEDVEGKRIDPRKSHVVARFSWSEWTRLAARIGDLPTNATWTGGADFLADDEYWTLEDADFEEMDREVERRVGHG